MKTLSNHMKFPYRMEIVEDQTEGGFVVSFPEIPDCATCFCSCVPKMMQSIPSK